YAREVTYWLASPAEGLAALDRAASRPRPEGEDETVSPEAAAHVGLRTTPALRLWHRHDAWGLLRLYDAGTPRRVQVAESLTNDGWGHPGAGGGRTWSLPLLEPRCVAYVCDRGVRLGGWLRLRYGRGSQPHQLWLMAHPDDADLAPALVRFGLRALARGAARPVLCQARGYEGPGIDALHAAGFEHSTTHALLVRHLTMRALRKREVPALEPRVIYGVKGLGSTPTRLSEGQKTHYAARDH